jgi:DNA mismatch repair protein MutS
MSTFTVEISELRVILKMANENSMILGDELCSGTETESALSIFVASMMHICKQNSSFIFATHFHEIVDYEEIKSLKTLKMYHMCVIFDKEQNCLIYDRKMKPGSGESIYGLEVCKSLHLDDIFLKNAYELRNKYFTEKRGELSRKTSPYNSKKIRSMCELCEEELSSEVHHIEYQKFADEKGYINGFHKNHLGNLLSVCESCHNKLHNENNIIKKKKIIKNIEII